MTALAGPSHAPLLRSGARAGDHIVWIGGPITNGRDATDTTTRMTTIASRMLGLTPHVYATDTATLANGYVTLANNAKNDSGYDHSAVGYAIVCGGLNDAINDLPTIISKTRTTLATLTQTFPAARIIVGACPGSIASMSDEQIRDNTTILSAILGEARAINALAINLRGVCGTDDSMQSTGIRPNDTGHEALADMIVEAIEDDRAEPVDAPITPTRTYTSGLSDWASRQVEATRRREAEKREANRPTGTELGCVTEKLDQLTQAQGVQQVLLEQQQEQLQKQQEELENQQKQLKAAQDQLASQQKQLKAAQDQLASQQTQLKAAQDQLAQQQAAIKAAQDQLKQQQTQLGNQQGQLDSAQQQFEASIRNYVNNELVPKLNTEFNKVNARLDALEKGTPA